MVPIQNIYFLLCYAWDRLDALDDRRVRELPDGPVLSMLGSLLLKHLERLVRAGLPQNYDTKQAALSSLKGRILPLTSQRNRFRHRMQCEFDELSHDTPFNQMLFASLDRLTRTEQVIKEQQQKAQALRHYFGQIQSIELSASLFCELRRLRLLPHQHLLVHLCELLFESSLPSETEGRYLFADFRRDPTKMAALFEAFCRNFYRHESKQFRVGREHIQWQVKPMQNEAQRLFPRMETDISLTAKGKKIIIDTKFYPEALASNRFGTAKFRPPHLYQIFAYLKNAEVKDQLSKQAEGMLLYPTAAPSKSYDFQMENHLLKIGCINLTQNWRGIKRDLLAFIGE